MAMQTAKAPASISSILARMLPEDIRVTDSLDKLRDKPGGLKKRYRPLLFGYEHYSWSEGVLAGYLCAFEQALQDIRTCASCRVRDIRTYEVERGERTTTRHHPRGCQASGPGMWYGLSRSACAEYERPSFAMHECPGPQRRMQQVWRDMRSKKHTEGEDE